MSAGDGARERALRFVLHHGDALGRARATAFADRASLDALLAALDAAAPVGDGPRAACVRLGVCDDHRALASRVAEETCARLCGWQDAEGAWGPDADLDGRLQTTGMLVGFLAKTRFARPDTLEAAGDFLALHFAPERLQGFQWANIAAYAHAFANLSHESSDAALQWCGRELERGFRARVFDAVSTARVLVWCDAHALPGAQLDAAELLVALMSEQRDDGSYGDADEPAARTGHTLDAVAALLRLGGRRGV